LNISELQLIQSGCRTALVRPNAALHRSGTAHYRRPAPVLRLVFCAALGYHVAMNNESVDNIASKLAEAVPEGLRAVRDDLEQNFRAVLRSSLGKLDLVTREEFEVQQAVLARTREKLEALEAKLKELEGK
jgi:BMFP domain-containing protein YqiC